jgi:hypothetical protein
MRFLPGRRSSVSTFGVALLLAIPLGVAAAAGGGHGSLDPTFGKGGKVTTVVGEGDDDDAVALVEQKDGSSSLQVRVTATRATSTWFATSRQASSITPSASAGS